MTAPSTDTSFLDHMPPNVAVQFLERVAATPDGEAYLFPHTEDGEDHWHSVDWREVGERVTKLAAGLISLGIEPEQRVGIAAGTRYEWILADLAVMCAGGATTTVYPSTNADDTAYILSDAQCRVVFAEDDAQLAKILDADLPDLVRIVTFDGSAVSHGPAGDRVISLEHLEEIGEVFLSEHPGLIEQVAKGIAPD